MIGKLKSLLVQAAFVSCCSKRNHVIVLFSRPFHILLGNFLATFRIFSNFFVKEQLVATFRKTSTFLVTFGLFWTKCWITPLFLNKQVKILLVKILNIFLVKLIFLPFEWLSCGRDNWLQEMGLGSLNLFPRAFPCWWAAKSPGNAVGGSLCTVCKQNGGRHVVFRRRRNRKPHHRTKTTVR